MNYWINSHWPPFLQHKPTATSPDPEYHYRVYLPDGREAAGEELKRGDLIFIYETKYGRPRKDGTKYALGQQGIIALVRALTEIREIKDEKLEEYTDGTSICWKWQAETEVDRLGFCSRHNLCNVLGYKRNYTLRGFGDLKSGLRKISEDQFQSILNKFR